MESSLRESSATTLDTTSDAAAETVLVVGATGSIGQLVVAEALRAGFAVRALVRDASRAERLPSQAERCVADLEVPQSLVAAVSNIAAVVFTHGAYQDDSDSAERVDYGGVRNLLMALQNHTLRVALMSTIGVTNRNSEYNRATSVHDWKRRSERLVRASGHPYTIVRPGWFDLHGTDQHRLVLLQGDTRRSGTPNDGVVSRQQVAEILVRSLRSSAAAGKTFELVAETGSATHDFDALFATVDADVTDGTDGIHDATNMPLSEEPLRVRRDMQRLLGKKRGE